VLKSLAYIVFALILAGGFYTFMLAPHFAARSARLGTVGASPAAAIPQITVQYAKPNFFDVVVSQGKLLSPAVIDVRQGDEIMLHIAADISDEFHLDGYDLNAPITPEKSVTLKFSADRAGRFDYKLTQSGQKLGVLQVAAKQQ
jgi:hypothetical protein